MPDIYEKNGPTVLLETDGAKENALSVGCMKPAPRKLGDWKGLVRVAPDFDEWPDDLAEAFGMRGEAGR